jgi:hypothetical protein
MGLAILVEVDLTRDGRGQALVWKSQDQDWGWTFRHNQLQLASTSRPEATQQLLVSTTTASQTTPLHLDLAHLTGLHSANTG